MANDFNLCKMVNKQVPYTGDVNNINETIKENIYGNYITTQKTYILNIVLIINVILLSIFVILFSINLFRYIHNINNYMFIFLIFSLVFLISSIVTLYFYIKSRK